jgi:hypothetical protein
MTEVFALEEIKEYWCIVSLNDDKDDARVLRLSEDIRNDDVLTFCNGTHLDESKLEQMWIEDWIDEDETISGVYKLHLDPIYIEDDEDNTREFAFLNVTKIEMLYALETLPVAAVTP